MLLISNTERSSSAGFNISSLKMSSKRVTDNHKRSRSDGVNINRLTDPRYSEVTDTLPNLYHFGQPQKLFLKSLDSGLSSPQFEGDEQARLRIVLQQRTELAEIVPSIADELTQESLNPVPHVNSYILQTRLVDHLQSFLQNTAVPAILKCETQRDEFGYQIRRAQEQVHSRARENEILKSKIEDLYSANAEMKTKLETLKSSNLNYKRLFEKKGENWKDDSQENAAQLEQELAETKSKLIYSMEDVETLTSIRNELEEELTTAWQKVDELEYEKQLAIAQMRAVCLEAQELLEENTHLLTAKNKELAETNEEMRRIETQREELKGELYDNIVSKEENLGEGGNVIEIPFDEDLEEGLLSDDMFMRSTEGDVEIYNLNEELEVEEYLNADDMWLDEEVWSESEEYLGDKTPPPLYEEENKSRPSEVDLPSSKLGLNFSISRGEIINVGIDSPKAEVPVHTSQVRPRVQLRNRRRKKSVGRAYLQKMGVENQQVYARGTRSFKAALTLFKKLEEINPHKLKAPEEHAFRLKDHSSVLERSRGKIKMPPSVRIIKPEAQEKATNIKPGSPRKRVVARVKVRKKNRYLDPTYTGYLKIPKSSQHSKHWKTKFEHKFFVCLDALPRTTNVNREEPIWTKAKTDEELKPCIFWFENETKYKKFIRKTKKIHVRSKEFQMLFAEMALGVIVLSQASAVNTSERRAIKLLSTMAGRRIELPQEIAEISDVFEDVSDFFIVSTAGDMEDFDSHKFRAKTKASRDKWMLSIRTLLKRRMQSLGGETLKGMIENLRNTGELRASSRRSSLQSSRGTPRIRMASNFGSKLYIPLSPFRIYDEQKGSRRPSNHSDSGVKARSSHPFTNENTVRKGFSRSFTRDTRKNGQPKATAVEPNDSNSMKNSKFKVAVEDPDNEASMTKSIGELTLGDSPKKSHIIRKKRGVKNMISLFDNNGSEDKNVTGKTSKTRIKGKPNQSVKLHDADQIVLKPSSIPKIHRSNKRLEFK